jgi:hypothetical protein
MYVMKKYALLALSLATIVGLVGLSSCSKDDPAPPAKASFSKTQGSAGEGDGVAEVDVILDRAASQDVVVEYTISGTATEGTDYDIDDSGEVEIKKGQTKGTVSINITDDHNYEGNETLKLSIDKVSTNDVMIGDDDEFTLTIQENDAQITASFATASRNVVESDGLIEIPVQLSIAAPADMTIKYKLTGSATDSVTAVSSTPKIPYDYAVRTSSLNTDLTPGEFVIKAGQTSGVIRIALYSDFIMEDENNDTPAWDPEKIVISLTESAGIILGSTSETTISIKQENGKAIVLLWDQDYTTVDMDLALWIEPGSADGGVVALSAYESFESPELVFIPATIKNASFGVSYTYYAGDVEPMSFQAQFVDFTNLVFESLANRDVFDGEYTLANINAWVKVADMKVEQTFDIEDGVYVNITDINKPSSGSRVVSPRGTVPEYLNHRTLQPHPRATVKLK